MKLTTPTKTELRAQVNRMRPVYRAAGQWFAALRPTSWSVAKHLANPGCNITSDAAEKLARAYARAERAEKGKKR